MKMDRPSRLVDPSLSFRIYQTEPVTSGDTGAW
jgi:hypothetical protein